MELTIQNAHLYYEDMICKPIVRDSGCDCQDNQYTPDTDRYFMVCNMCGECVDLVNETVICYTDSKYLQFRTKRCYKRSAYLRLKMNNIFRCKLPSMPEQYINLLKKKQNINITSLIRYMKKKKFMKKYDPLKSLYQIKEIEPIQLSDSVLVRLIDCFSKKEKIYKDNDHNRFNYNFVIMKIFEEWNDIELFKCFKSLQDERIMNQHEQIYNKLFKHAFQL